MGEDTNGVSAEKFSDENGEKVEKSKVEGEEMGNHGENLELECEKEKENRESENRVRLFNNFEVMGEDTNGVSMEKISDKNGVRVEKSKGEGEEMGNHGESLELECEKENENVESERGVKLDDNCEVMGEDTNGISVEKNGFDEETSSLRKRLRGGVKRVNYNEDALDKEIEAILGKKIRKRRGGQKGKKFVAERVQEKEFTTKKKRGRKSKKYEKVKESVGLTSEGAEAGDAEEEDEGEDNKVRRMGRKKQGKKLEEESGGDLRISKNQKEQEEKKVNKRMNGTSLMCHQCQRNDKGRVVRCEICTTKRFCIPCITNWYPKMSEEQIANRCPVCLGNCNCKSCLRMEGLITFSFAHHAQFFC